MVYSLCTIISPRELVMKVGYHTHATRHLKDINIGMEAVKWCSHPISGNFKLSLCMLLHYQIKAFGYIISDLYSNTTKYWLKWGYLTWGIYHHQFWLESLRKEDCHLNVSLFRCKTFFSGCENGWLGYLQIFVLLHKSPKINI